MKAIVLLSGGIDSAVCAALAARGEGAADVGALTLLYGQKHKKEIAAAEAIAGALGLGKHIVHGLPPIFAGFGSTLIDADRPNPEMTYSQLRAQTGLSPTYVPFRNANFLSVATSLALVYEADAVYYGAHAEDARNWAYPDCTPEFNGAMANAIYVGTYHQVRLITPLQWMMKKDVVKLGLELGVPFHLTWSCYNGRDKACGKCPTCVERLEAFRSLGLTDPIEYEEGES